MHRKPTLPTTLVVLVAVLLLPAGPFARQVDEKGATSVTGTTEVLVGEIAAPVIATATDASGDPGDANVSTTIISDATTPADEPAAPAVPETTEAAAAEAATPTLTEPIEAPVAAEAAAPTIAETTEALAVATEAAAPAIAEATEAPVVAPEPAAPAIAKSTEAPVVAPEVATPATTEAPPVAFETAAPAVAETTQAPVAATEATASAVTETTAEAPAVAPEATAPAVAEATQAPAPAAEAAAPAVTETAEAPAVASEAPAPAIPETTQAPAAPTEATAPAVTETAEAPAVAPEVPAPAVPETTQAPAAAEAAAPPAASDAAAAGVTETIGNDKLDEKMREAAGRAGTSRAIVRFNSERGAEAVLDSLGIQHVRDLQGSHVVELPNAVIRQLAAERSVVSVSMDRIASGSMFRVTGTIQSDYVNTVMKYTGRNVGVAIIDSGLALHDDLDKRGKSMSAWVDFVNGAATQYDDFGHGTNIGGIISGDGYDSKGRHPGVAPDARLIALKALNANGEGYVSDIIAALEWATDKRRQYNIRVINISASAPVLESAHTDPLCLAVKAAVESGITVVASAGNMGRNAATGKKIWGGIGAPGNCPWALTVGASSDEGDRDRGNDVMATFSSRGPTRFDIQSKPDISAPGTGIVAPIAWRSQLYTHVPGLLYDGPVKTAATVLAKPYMAMSGTSMSAAVVSGIVALMVQANPALTPNLIKAILQYTAEVNPNYHVLEQGGGFVNARDAVELSEFFRKSGPGATYPSKPSWSKQIIWGNLRISGGLLTPNANAWTRNQQWGASKTLSGTNIVWGDNCSNWLCTGATRSHGGIWGSYVDDNIVWGNYADDNIVWGNYWDDNIVWGNRDDENIVWGNSGDDNIVWGNRDDDNIVWGNRDDDNIVWGNRDDDNIVWGNRGDDDNIVWGNRGDDDNIVWGNYTDDNIVWGNRDDDNIVWGNRGDDDDNIVWGNYRDDNIVWGNRDDENIVWGNYSDDNIVWGNNGEDNIVWGNGANSLFRWGF